MEKWAPIPEHEGYFISNYGNVLGKRGNLLKKQKHSKGYLIVVLCNHHTCKTRTIHSLVAESFIGSRPKGYDIHHKDEDKTNNHDINLEYILKCHHAKFSHKRPRFGENHYAAKLKNKDIPIIRNLLSMGMSLRSIGRIYSVNHATIKGIKNNIKWKHI